MGLSDLPLVHQHLLTKRMLEARPVWTSVQQRSMVSLVDPVECCLEVHRALQRAQSLLLKAIAGSSSWQLALGEW